MLINGVHFYDSDLLISHEMPYQSLFCSVFYQMVDMKITFLLTGQTPDEIADRSKTPVDSHITSFQNSSKFFFEVNFNDTIL